MDHSGYGGGGSSGGVTIRPDSYLAQMYWIFVGGFIAVAALVNLKEYAEYRLRMNDASKARPDPARPKNILSGTFATVTAISREFCNYAIPLIPKSKDGTNKWNDRLLRAFPRLSHLPPFGYMWLMASNLALLLAIIFFGFDAQDQLQYETIGTRAGWMTLAQLPLVFLMAGKANIVGRLTGTSYERLNWIHRSVSRCMFITAGIHMSYFLRSWARYNYIERKLEIDIHTRTGLASFCVLAWLFISSLSPIRGWRYEIFVIQHMISAIGLLVIIWMHVPDEADIYVWLPVSLWAVDRLVRWAFVVYHNLSIFHPKEVENGSLSSSVFACKATFDPLPDKATRITIRNPPMMWRPGQHAFISCHSLAPFQSHPFTITSLPSDGYIEFVVRAHGGTTGKLHQHSQYRLPPHNDRCKTVFLDGPYGRFRPLEQFDSVVLLSGSTGASFCVPLLRDLLRIKSSNSAIVTRKIRFIWVIKTRGQMNWFGKMIGEALQKIKEFDDFEIEASIYVTCDPDLTAEVEYKPRSEVPDTPSSSHVTADGEVEKYLSQVRVVEDEKPGCGADGRCCCRDVVEDEDAIVESGGAICCCTPAKPKDDTQTKPRLDNKIDADNPLAQMTSHSSNAYRAYQLPGLVNFISGRPMVKNLIEKELQNAVGESAVVVCGPRGLVEATRAAVVELSDERAVHKGSGAQGIYLHTETFSW